MLQIIARKSSKLGLWRRVFHRNGLTMTRPEQIDYDKTLAREANYSSIKAISFVAVQMGWYIEQDGVKLEGLTNAD